MKEKLPVTIKDLDRAEKVLKELNNRNDGYNVSITSTPNGTKIKITTSNIQVPPKK